MNGFRGYLKRMISFQTIRIWPALLPLFAIFLYIMNTTVQGLEVGLLFLIISVGLILSWLVSLTRVPGWIAISGAVLSGLTLLLVRVGKLGNLLLDLLDQIGRVFNQTWRWIFYAGAVPSADAVQQITNQISTKISNIGLRLGDWFTNLIYGNPLYDPVATAFIWGFVIWTITFWTVWYLFRHSRPLTAIIPILLLITFSLDYTERSYYFLVPIIGAFVGLQVLVVYDTKEREWQKQKVDYAGIIWEKTLPAALILAAGLMVLSAVSPSLTIDRIKNYVNRISDNDDDQLARSVGIEPEPRPDSRDPRVVDVFDNMRDGGLPNQHLVGVNPDVFEQLVMVVQVEELNPTDSDQEEDEDKKYYWRGLTYDQYIGYGWVSRNSTEQKINPGDRTLTSWPESYRIIRQSISYTEDLSGLLYSAGLPLSSDETMQVSWRVNDPTEDAYDIFGVATKAEDFWVDSLQPEATIEELRGAGQFYPRWIRERYLDLPDSVSERIHTLARDLTVAEPTPYDRAVAIESFLRDIPYTLDVPQPPEDKEITEYFIYEIKKGYCDYYATAMVVLSRAAGLPARLVTGYIGGYYDEESDSYLVSSDFSHAWVEIYFPQYGWIIFEPTGGRPAVNRPTEPIPKFSEDYTFTFEPLVPPKKDQVINWRLILTSLPLVVTGLGAAIILIDIGVIRTLPGKVTLPIIFRRIQRFSRRIRITTDPGDTGNEFMTRLYKKIEDYSQGSKNSDWLLSGTRYLERFTQVYYLVSYSNQQDQGINPKEITHLYRKIRQRLLYLWILVHTYPYWIFRVLLWKNTGPLPVQSVK